MAWFRCKFRKKQDPIISYKLTCAGSKANATFEKYIDDQLSETKNLSIGSTNFYEGKIRVYGGSNGQWQIYVIENYVEYDGTKYSTITGNPMINYPNGNPRATFIFTETDE